jgi:hypothetical protein
MSLASSSEQHRCPKLPLLLVAATFLSVTVSPLNLAAQTGQRAQIASSKTVTPLPSEEQWAAQAVNSIRGQNITRAVFPQTLPASAPVTRAKFAALMQRVFVLEPPAHPVEPSDVGAVPRPEFRSILALAPYLAPPRASNVPFLFRPETAITREDSAAAVVRLISKFTATKVLSAGESESALRGMPDKGSISPSLRPLVATAVHLGILNALTGSRFGPGSSLTVGDTEKAVTVLENDAIPARALPCPPVERTSSAATKPKVVEVATAKAANPSVADLCTTRAAASRGDVVTLVGGTGPQFAAITGRPFAPGSAQANAFQVQTRPASQGPRATVSNQRLQLTRNFFGFFAPQGQAPAIYQGFTTSKGGQAGLAGLNKWAQQRIALKAPDPTCNVPGQSPGLFCYTEQTVSASVICDYPGPACPGYGTYALTLDALRSYDPVPSPPGHYLLAASWESNPGGACQSLQWPQPFPLSSTCGPYVSQLSVSIPVGTIDTSSAPSASGPSWCTLTPCMMSSGPGTSQGTVSTNVSDSVGISPSNQGLGGSLQVQVQQQWTLPDIVIYTNTDGNGYPPNTGSWIEKFAPPNIQYDSQSPPNPDAMNCTGGPDCGFSPSEIAAFQVDDSMGPFVAEADGAGIASYNSVIWVPTLPFTFLAPLAGFIPITSTQQAAFSVDNSVILQPPWFLVCGGGFSYFTGFEWCISPQQPIRSVQMAPGGTLGVVVYAMEEGYQTPLEWYAASRGPMSVAVSPCGGPSIDCSGVAVSSTLVPLPGLTMETLSAPLGAQPTGSGQPVKVIFQLNDGGLADSELELDVTITQPPPPPFSWRPPFALRHCPAGVTSSWCAPSL